MHCSNDYCMDLNMWACKYRDRCENSCGPRCVYYRHCAACSNAFKYLKEQSISINKEEKKNV